MSKVDNPLREFQGETRGLEFLWIWLQMNLIIFLISIVIMKTTAVFD